MPKIANSKGREFAEIGTLLRNLRLRRGMSQFDLASAVGINNSYLSRIENGERRPSPKVLRKFSEALSYPYEELVVTSGILTADFVRSTPPEPPKRAEPSQDMLRQFISSMQGQQGYGMVPVHVGQKRSIPVFDSVPAGFLREANVVEAYADMEKLVLSEDELGYDARAFALIVSGDSMVEAGILDGDVLVVSPSTPVGPGDIGVVLVNKSTTTVKKIYIEADRVILQPANSHYKPQVLAYPDEVEVLGKVILVRRKLM
jgi:SOS-response transcriptional repressor LexA